MRLRRVIAGYVVGLSIMVAGFSCTGTNVTNGGGTDVANAQVSGVILDNLGNPVVNVPVRLLPYRSNWYVDSLEKKDRSRIVKTDSLGRYVFDSLWNDTFNVECSQKSGKILVQKIVTSHDLNEVVGHRRLQHTGSVRVAVPATLKVYDDLLVYVPGTTLHWFFDWDEAEEEEEDDRATTTPQSRDSVTLTGLPVCKIPLIRFIGVKDDRLEKDEIAGEDFDVSPDPHQ